MPQPIKKKEETCDILIIGAGMTGLMCAAFLKNAGIKKILLLDQDPVAAVSLRGAGSACAYPRDNITRIHHAYGEETTARYLACLDTGWSRFREFHEGFGLPLATLPFIRMATTDHEDKEFEAAARILAALGKKATLTREAAEIQRFGLQAGYLKSLQCDGEQAAIVNTGRLAALALESSQSFFRQARVTSFSEDSRSVTVLTANGERICTEMLILATHLGIRRLLPSFQEIAIPVSEQWATFLATEAVAQEGYVFTAQHGYYWGNFNPATRTLALGGGRFLRKHAGIGLEEAEASAKIRDHLLQTARSLWGADVIPAPIEASPFASSVGTAGLDCQPCDELPVIGPLPGSGRILTSFGYNGHAYAIAAAGADALKEIIVNGRCDSLPRFLSPERFRSLEARTP